MEKNNIEARLTPAIFFGSVILLAYAFFLILKPFAFALVWGAVFAVAAQPLYRFLLRKTGPNRAAAITTLALMLVVVIPAVFLVSVLVNQSFEAAARFKAMDPQTLDSFLVRTHDLWNRVRAGVPYVQDFDVEHSLKTSAVAVSQFFAAAAARLAGSTVEFLANMVLTLISVFFLLSEGDALARVLRHLSPFDREDTDSMFEEVGDLTRGSVIAMLLIALLQGLLGGIAAAVSGLPSPVIWGALFGVTSLIPVVGTALAWMPATIWLFIVGNKVGGAIMVAISLLVIIHVDTVVRPLFVSGKGKMRYSLSALSVLGGVAAFGMLGIVLGPVVMALVIALIETYIKHKSGLGRIPATTSELEV